MLSCHSTPLMIRNIEVKSATLTFEATDAQCGYSHQEVQTTAREHPTPLGKDAVTQHPQQAQVPHRVLCPSLGGTRSVFPVAR
jgi:hypothetical protein